MSNDVEVYLRANVAYPWNPFNDRVDCTIEKELIHSQGPKQPIIIPRCGPFFATESHPGAGNGVRIWLKESNRELTFENGDFSFVYPFRAFNGRYNQLAYGGIVLHKQVAEADYYVTYTTIGGDFVLDDVTYAALVANVVNNPRTADWSQLINVPEEFEPDPHDHPASNTFNYYDLTVWLKSYLDALMNMDVSLTTAKLLADHIQDNIQKAHGGTLADLGIKYLKDYPICDENSLKGESNQVYCTVWGVKYLIRTYFAGEWQ